MTAMKSSDVNSSRRFAIVMTLTRGSLETACATCNETCFYGRSASDPTTLEIGHIVAKTVGGQYRLGNLIPQCRACNQAGQQLQINDWTPYVNAKWLALTPNDEIAPNVARELKRMLLGNKLTNAISNAPTLWQKGGHA